MKHKVDYQEWDIRFVFKLVHTKKRIFKNCLNITILERKEKTYF